MSLNSAIRGLQIQDSTITALQLATDAVETLKIKDGNVTEAKLDVNNAPVTDYFLKWNGTKLEWADVDVSAIQETDIITGEIPTASLVWGYLDEACSALGTWADNDAVNGVSTQETFDSQETFKFDTNASASSNKAEREITGLTSSDQFTVEIKLYLDAVSGETNDFVMEVGNEDLILTVAWRSDGIFVIDEGSVWNEAGTNEVTQDTWQTWKFVVDGSNAPASSTCDVYLNGSLVESGMDCMYLAGSQDGEVKLTLNGVSVSDRIAYVDYVKVGDGSASSTNFQLANTPLTDTERIYLNGLRQEEGSGKDYTVSGDTITFATALDGADILLVDYFIS